MLEELHGLEIVEEESALCGEEKVRKAKVISDLERGLLSWRR